MIHITIDIPEDVISSMFTTAFEQGAINYWCSKIDYEGKNKEYIADGIIRTLKEGRDVLVWAYTEDDGGAEEPYVLTLDNLRKGIQNYVDDVGEEFSFDWDASAADWILQHALFGELVYG